MTIPSQRWTFDRILLANAGDGVAGSFRLAPYRVAVSAAARGGGIVSNRQKPAWRSTSK